MKTPNTKITVESLITVAKIWLLGFLSAESFYFSQAIASKVNSYISSSQFEIPAIAVSSVYLLVVVVYLFYRDVPSDIVKLVKSKRIDLALAFIVGIMSSVFLGGVGVSTYQTIVSALTINQVLILITLPFVLMFSFLIHALHIWIVSKKKKDTPFFISDSEQRSKTEDLLGLSDIAERFAERVLNQGSSDSLVFGIDGPWGVGKSTFINFCKEYWESKYKNDVIVYVFNPLRYESRENLFEKFIDGLIRSIQVNSFVPELKPLISRYSQFVKSVKGSFFGFLNFEILGDSYSVDNAFEDLETALTSIDKKIIVVIDDLDRLNLSAVKDLLFTVKKSFTLPNISYVLCYDAENISSLEQEKPDIEKITEFLEKFVNVKVSLFLGSDKLTSYISTNLEKSLSGNSQADPILVSKAIGGLKDIFKSNEYYRYVNFIGDIRKLKRLINTVLLLDLEKTDFENSDIDNHDLIHLLLIYINYPTIFRKIYNSETDGKKGFFSLVSQYEGGYPKDDNRGTNFSDSLYKNSVNYSKYIESPSLSENQRFLLNKVFNVSRLEQRSRSGVSEEIRTSLACFNGDIWSKGSRNLEEYLNLIVQSSKPQTTGQYKFYLNQKNKLLSGTKIEDILSDEAFSYSKSESNQKQLWKVIINSAYEFSGELGTELITYLMNNITNYANFEYEELGLGLRHDLNFYLVKLLDQAGWVDENGKHSGNLEENIKEIAEWVLGEGKHKEKGVIQILSEETRGILGLYDLLSFRLFCSADRGGDVFNLQRSLSIHGDINAPSDGSTKIIAIEEMREISQRVFQVFKKQYIDTNKNIFDLVDKLTLHDLASQYEGFVKEKVKSGEIENVDGVVAALKTRIKMFIAYQLGSSSTEFGIACGYYDTEGKNDKNGIKTQMNNYIFDVCFNPGKKKDKKKNYEHFLDYLLTCFASTFESVKGRSYVPSINEFTKFLNKGRLREYWKSNEAKIKSLNFIAEDKSVPNGNYTAFYKDDLEEVYKVLDSLLDEAKEKTANGEEVIKEV